jgi:fibronectin-binding autotransporter adhesin
MKITKLFTAFILGLGLTLTLVCLLAGSLPVAHAVDITVGTYLDGVADNGSCTLREAIIAANTDARVDTCAAGGANDYINLKAATYVLTATGISENAAQTGDLDIADALTIEGAGPGNTIIDASGVISDRVFDIRSGAGTVVISGVTIINGNVTGHGGGIYSYDADLTLINVQVISNAANGTGSDGQGGGVYVRQGSLLLDGAHIISNTAGSSGGGVYVYAGSAMLSGGQILSNTASGGGGVHVQQATAAFTQTGGTAIAHNTATLSGGGVYIYEGSATLSGGQVFSNTASHYGGGVFVSRGSATLSGGQIISNTADDRGGGVYVYLGSATLSGGQVAGNTAPDGGGVYVADSSAVFTQTGGVLAHNTATDHGGGVYVHSGSATLSGGQILSNTAAIIGGGIYNNNGTLTLVNTTVSGNKATTNGGGGLWINGGTLALTYTTVASNTAGSAGGGIRAVAGSTVLVQNTIVAYNGPDNCNGTLTSKGHNLDGGTTCGFTASGDITDTNPLLGPLTDDGGTLVHPLLDGSPAIDAGACLAGITTDQRGETRPQGAACDIGAYEFYVPVAPTGVSITGPADGIVGESYAFTATVSPPTVTLPLTYTWTPVPDGGQGTSVATYSWTTPGTKTVTIMVENAAGIVPAPGTHDIVIANYQIYLPSVLNNYQ